jgi:exodeoxyribonuclease V alpha subunit
MNAAIPERRPATEEISGVIERVTFHNDESGFCVLRVKARGQREETTVVGSLPSVTAGEWLSAEGWWVRDKEHGLQFKATTMKTVPPTTAEGIERQSTENRRDLGCHSFVAPTSPCCWAILYNW